MAFEPCLSCPKPKITALLTIVGKAESVVAEGAIQVEVLGCGNSDFDLIFRPGISDDFPVVDAAGEPNVGDDRPEDIGLLLQEDVGVGLADDNPTPELGCVPGQIFAVGAPDDLLGFRLGYFPNDFVHLGVIPEVLGQLVQHVASQRAVRLVAFDRLVLHFFAVLEIPALDFQAEFLVGGEIKELDDFLALGVGASDIEAVV